MIAKYDEQARAAGIRIVNCCGFDSIPHDLGALFTRRLLPRDRPVQIEGFVRADGDVSGGTWNSALDIAEHGMPKTKQKRPPQADGRRVGSTRSLPRYSRTLHGWAVPLATIDPVVVKRSARALPEYGPDFRYGHFALGRSFARTALTTLAVASALTLATVKPVREKMRQFKKPGTGPSAEKRAKSFFEVTFVGRCGSQRVFTKVSGGDPGYTETSKMVSEAALALAFDRDTLPTGTGVVTPAVGLGDALLTRLQRAGIRFEQVDRV
jgi:short subunit dehydrogenase-like uncharacterized protein